MGDATRAVFDAPGAGPRPTSRLTPGDRAGGYTIVREIGAGGMGVVYEAAHDRLDRRAALKTLDGLSATPELASRLRAEAATLARLEHPGIARLYEVVDWRAPDTPPDHPGVTMLAMEYVPGEPLLDAARRLPLRPRLRLFCAICDAVHHAHLRGVVHRDLKPGNVLVRPGGEPVVLDFGLARVADDAPASRLTRTGELLGTVAYISPEQARQSPDLDLRADVYSLGVMLFELLTGALPIDDAGGSVVRALRAIELAPPTRPSALNPALRGDLDCIILRCLEKQPGRRYPSAEALAGDIRRHLEHRPIEARPPSALYRVSRYFRRHRPVALGVSGTILALSVGLAVATTQMVRARRAEARAVERFNDVRGLANTIIFDLHDAIASLPGSTGARAILVERALAYLGRLAADAPADDPAFRAELAAAYVRLGDVMYGYGAPGLGDAPGAHEAYRRAVAVIDAPPALTALDARRTLARALAGAALSHDTPRTDEAGRPADSPFHRRAAEVRRQIADSPGATIADHAAHAHALMRLAQRRTRSHGIDSALGTFEDALAALRAAGADDAPEALAQRATIWHARGQALWVAGRPAEAHTDYARAAAWFRSRLDGAPDDRGLMAAAASALAGQALTASLIGEPGVADAAAEALRLARRQRDLDPTDSNGDRLVEVTVSWVGAALENLADAPGVAPAERRRRLQEALGLHEEALALVLQRQARGALPEWESHYIEESRRAIGRVREAIAALPPAGPASP